jgi:hypothetical protein
MASNEIDRVVSTELVRAADPGLSALAEALVSAACSQGVRLTGPVGVLTGLTKQVRGCPAPR